MGFVKRTHFFRDDEFGEDLPPGRVPFDFKGDCGIDLRDFARVQAVCTGERRPGNSRLPLIRGGWMPDDISPAVTTVLH